MTILNYETDGNVAHVLSYSLRSKEPVTWVRMTVGNSNGHSEHAFFSEGDYRKDIVKECRDMTKYSDDGGKLPKDWEGRVLESKSSTIKVNGTKGLMLKVGSMNVKRIAEIARNGQCTNPIYDEERRQIVSREDLLLELRGAIADQLLNSNKYGDPLEIWNPPEESELVNILEKAGEVYDYYMSVPKGSLIVTKDFIFPYTIGRKKFPNLRWNSSRYLGQSWKGPRIPLAGNCVSFTGVDKAPYSKRIEDITFRGSFGFPMDFIRDTFAVPKNEEKDYIENAVESLGNFGSIWIQSPPYGIIEKNGMTHANNSNWHPTKEELIRASKIHLGIAV
jgi:hypothetical protein